jgi:hypothetical protein
MRPLFLRPRVFGRACFIYLRDSIFEWMEERKVRLRRRDTADKIKDINKRAIISPDDFAPTFQRGQFYFPAVRRNAANRRCEPQNRAQSHPYGVAKGWWGGGAKGNGQRRCRSREAFKTKIIINSEWETNNASSVCGHSN